MALFASSFVDDSGHRIQQALAKITMPNAFPFWAITLAGTTVALGILLIVSRGLASAFCTCVEMRRPGALRRGFDRLKRLR